MGKNLVMPKYLKDEVDETITDENVNFDKKCDIKGVVEKTKFEVKEEYSHDINEDKTIEDARDEVDVRYEYVSKSEDENTKLKIEDNKIEVIGEDLDKIEVGDVKECVESHVIMKLIENVKNDLENKDDVESEDNELKVEDESLAKTIENTDETSWG